MNGSKINPLKHSGNNMYQVFQTFKSPLLPTRWVCLFCINLTVNMLHGLYRAVCYSCYNVKPTKSTPATIVYFYEVSSTCFEP
jgi:ABC-type glucose/galactose transport system permease subunit